MQNKLKILCIGDLHIQPKNLSDVDSFLQELKLHLQSIKYDLIIILGDTLHTHEKVYTLALNKALEYFTLCYKHALTYVLIGNHDYINNSQFLSENHPFISFKYISDKLIIVNNVVSLVKEGLKLLFLPYVPDGRFMEALLLNSTINFKEYDIIFAHQLFDNVKMGAIMTYGVEEWKTDYPLVISGHIHNKQRPQDNLHYTGSSLQHSYGENGDKSISCYTINYQTKEIILEEIFLDIPTKKIFYVDEKSVYTVENKLKTNLKNIQYKIIVGSNREFLKSFKCSSVYESLLKKAKISLKCVDNNKIIKNSNDDKKIDFYNILKKLISDSPDLIDIYNMFQNIQ